MNDLKILSHGRISDLSNGFSLGGKTFSVCLVPKRTTMETLAVVDCRLVCDKSSSPLPVPLNDWTPAKIQSISKDAIDLDEFDVYWGAHETI